MQIELSNPLFESAKPILKKISSHGYEAYFVGGSVRDTLLGLPIHDIDIASSALPEEIERIFNITIDVGKEHGTIIVVEKGVSYEITTFRVEGDYSDYRHPDYVNFVRDLKEDTLRRDFTINALALDYNGKLYDYHQGLADLQTQTIRAVGVPSERFEEDALRIVRAIRFASQLGFTIEANTLVAIKQTAHLLPNIATERIRIELTKFFLGAYFKQNALLFSTTTIAEQLPIMQGYDVLSAMSEMQFALDTTVQLDEVFVWYFFCDSLKIPHNNVKKFLKQWTHSNQLIDSVLHLYELAQIFSERTLTKWDVYRYPITLVERLEQWLIDKGQLVTPTASALYQSLVIFDKKAIVVNGKKIMDWLHLTQGNQRLGTLIQQIEYHIVTDQLNNEEQAIFQFVQANY